MNISWSGLRAARAARVALISLVIACGVLLGAPVAHATPTCDVTWTGPSSGQSWANASFWSTGSVPTASSTVCVPSGTSLNVNNGTSALARDLQASGASLTISSGGSLSLAGTGSDSVVSDLWAYGTLTVAGDLSLTRSVALSGTVTGGGEVQLAASVTGSMVDGTTLDAAVLRVDGTTFLGNVIAKNGAAILNHGVVKLQSNSGYSTAVSWNPADGSLPVFDNYGVVQRPVSYYTSTIGVGFVNHGSGVVEVLGSSGIDFTRGVPGSVSTGKWKAATVYGLPTLRGAFAVGGDIGDRLSVQGGGTLTVPAGQSASIKNLTVSGSAIVAQGQLVATVRLDIGASSTLSGWSSVKVAPGATSSLDGATLDAGTFRNDGAVSLGTVIAKNGAVIDNYGDVTLENSSGYGTAVSWTPNGDAPPVFNNYGVLKRLTHYYGATIGIGFANHSAGVVDVRGNGPITFTRGAPGTVSTGKWNAATTSGYPVLQGAFSVGGGDIGNRLVVQNGGTLTVPAGYGASVGNLTVSASGLVVSGQLETTSVMYLRSSTSAVTSVSGQGTLTNTAVSSSTVEGVVIDGTTVRNDGSMMLGNVQAKNGAVIDNRSDVTLQSDSGYNTSVSWTPNGDALPVFKNFGVVRRTANNYASTISVGFVNHATGVVDVQGTGSINFMRDVPGTVSTGKWKAANESGLPLISGAFSVGGGDIGNRLAVQSGGTLTVPSGDSASIGKLSVSASSLVVSGSLETTSSLYLRSSTSAVTSVSGQGTLTNTAVSSSTVEGVVIDGTTVRNDGSMMLGNVQAKNGAVIDNRSDVTLQSDSGYNTSVSWTPNGDALPVFKNFGVVRRTANNYASTISVGFVNHATGVVDVQGTGSINFMRDVPGTVSTGKWKAAGDTGVPVLRSTFSIGGEQIGSRLTVQNGTINVPSGQSPSIGRLTASSATVNAAGTLTVTLGLQLQTSTVTGPGSLRTGAVQVGGIYNATIDGGSLRNEGVLTMDNGQVLTGTNGGTVDNHGLFVFNAESSGMLVGTGSTKAPVFINRGILQKTAGNGTAYVRWNYGEAGTIQETAGRIQITGQYVRVPFDPTDHAGGSNLTTPSIKACPEADPVDCVTGDFYENLTDLVVAGRGPALAATRSYSAMIAAEEGQSGTANAARLSAGWTHAYAARLSITSGHVKVHGPNGATTTFNQTPSGGFTAASSVKATLTNGSGGSYVLTYRDQTKDAFDSGGRLTKKTDRNGYETTLSYTSGGRLDRVTNQAGRTLTYAYDSAGRISSIEDPLGRTVQYGYDSAGNLATVTDPAGKQTTFGYDGKHRVTSMTDPRGKETVNTYDSSDRVLTQRDAASNTVTFAYTTDTTTFTDARGHVTRYERTDDGMVRRVVRGVGTPQEAAVAMVRDLSGNVTQRTDPNGQVTKVEYDTAGNATKMTDPLNRVTTMTYNAASDLLTVKDPSNVMTTMTYDTGGNVTSIARPLTGTSSTATTTFAYDPSNPGDLVTKTDATGKEWTFDYDDDGNQTAGTDPLGDKATTAYNAIGWPTSSVTPRGNENGADPDNYKTTITYDNRGLVTSTTDPAGATTSTVYDNAANPTSVTQPGDKTTTTTYDDLNRPTLVTRPGGSMLRFGYDANGNRTSVKDGLNHETTYAYDALDRKTSETDAANRTTEYSYDLSGRQTGTEDAMGRTTTLDFDAASQLQNIDYSSMGTPDVDYDYDVLGRRTSMVDGTGTSTWAYDSLGRLISSQDGSGRQLAYSYDLESRLKKLTYPAGLVNDTVPTGQTITAPAVTRELDDAGQITKITDWLGHETTYDYDPDGHLTAQNNANGTTVAQTYDEAGRLTQRTDTGPGQTEILNLPYEHRTNGQLNTQNRPAVTPAETETFTYDALDQLEQGTVATGNTAGTFSYAHDVADRLTQINTPSAQTTLEYDTVNQLVRTKDTQTGQTLSEFSFNQVGDRTQQDPAGPVDPTEYTYDQASRLAGVNGPAPDPADPDIDRDYTYDGDGLRSDLLWDSTGELLLVLGDTNGLYVHGPDGLPVTQLTYTKTQRTYHHDQLGSTRALTNPTGAVTDRYRYDPYGNPLAGSNATDSRFGYAGQYTDRTTGLIYMRARWYDPNTATFITSDPIGHASGETNVYRYAGGDPANYTDPSGLLPSLRDVSNFAAGAGDTTSFGLTKKFRRAVGVDNVDYCSDAYRNGGYTATGVELATGAGALKAAAKHATRAGAKRLAKRFADETGSYRPNAWVPKRSTRSVDAGMDGTGKVHGNLPNPAQLERYNPEELSILRDELSESIAMRNLKNAQYGADAGHTKRLQDEIALAQRIDKHLAR